MKLMLTYAAHSAGRSPFRVSGLGISAPICAGSGDSGAPGSFAKGWYSSAFATSPCSLRKVFQIVSGNELMPRDGQLSSYDQ